MLLLQLPLGLAGCLLLVVNLPKNGKRGEELRSRVPRARGFLLLCLALLRAAALACCCLLFTSSGVT